MSSECNNVNGKMSSNPLYIGWHNKLCIFVEFFKRNSSILYQKKKYIGSLQSLGKKYVVKYLSLGRHKLFVKSGISISIHTKA